MGQPGLAPPGQAPPPFMPPPLQPPPAAKPKGRKRKAFGIVLAVLSVFPMLAGGAVLAQAYSNHQIQVPNSEFAPVAWHNLRSDQIFPDYLAYGSRDAGSRTWSRQMIAKEASCQEALRKDFAAVATANNCRTVLRATYVHIDGSVAATIGLVVLGSNNDAKALANEDFDLTAEPGPLVYPVAAPGTPAAKWTKERALAGNAIKIGLSLNEEPYVVATSVGSIDTARAVGQLPEEWDMHASDEIGAFGNYSSNLVLEFANRFDQAMRGSDG
ncbi:hypothetical protein WEI85_45820 [Actinomycetes bacterium KLBMP 9797]